MKSADTAPPRAQGYDAEDDFRVSLSRAAARQGYAAPRLAAVAQPSPSCRHASRRRPHRAGWSMPSLAPAPSAPPAPGASIARRGRRAGPAPQGRGRGAHPYPAGSNDKLMAEMAGIRNMLERQLAGFAWGEQPRGAGTLALDRGVARGRLLRAAVAAHLRGSARGCPVEEVRALAKSLINRQLRALSPDADIIDRGGVCALVGPTGVERPPPPPSSRHAAWYATGRQARPDHHRWLPHRRS